MATELERESTEYVFFGITGSTIPSTADVAFLAAGVRPTTEWKAAIIVNNSGHSLWADAQASGVVGTYFVARLVGSFNANDLILTAATYQPWIRLTGTNEQAVRRASVTLTVL